MIKRALCAAVLVAACGGATTRVTRVVDGQIVEGRFVSPQAYAMFLKGAIAEASGTLDEAIRAYEAVAKVDTVDPEVFARIARARCARDPHDAAGKAAVGRALALDPDYGPAWAAASVCGGGGDVAALERAARAEPRDVPIQVAFARALEQSSSAHANATRARLLALTLEQPESSEALSALSSWADAHDDLDLLVLSLTQSAEHAPRLDAAVARAALSLAAEGQLGHARRVAAALFDERARPARSSPPLDEPLRISVGRLAADEAAERGDAAALERRALAAHLTTADAAARAALAGRADIARALATATLAADPNDFSARMILASDPATRTDLKTAFAGAASPATHTVPALVCSLFARAILRSSGAAEAHAALASIMCDPIPRDDTPALSLAVDLAARNIINESTLPLEAHIELAWRKREPLHATPLTNLDPRHELLARAQAEPLSARSIDLAAKLARRTPVDPIVLASLLSVARARGQTVDQLARAALGPVANPVLDATLLDALPSAAPERVRVRARFAGLAATPAERALLR